MCEAPAFSGFPKEGLEFLEDLALNNNREWFQARKDDYQDYVLESQPRISCSLWVSG